MEMGTLILQRFTAWKDEDEIKADFGRVG